MYQAKPPRWIFSLFAPLFLGSLSISETSLWALIPPVTAFLFFAVSFQMTVGTFITYEIRWFKFTVYKRKFAPSDIKTIILRVGGWGEPAGTIKRINGWNVRLVNYHSVALLSDVERFAEENQVHLEERKNYRAVFEGKKRKEERSA